MFGQRRRSKLNILNNHLICFILIAVFICLKTIFSVRAETVYDPIRVKIEFACQENLKLSDGLYRISIRTDDDMSPVPEQSRVDIKNGEGSFYVTVKEPGTYSYIVWQEKGDSDGVIYDSSVYEVHLFVTDDRSGQDQKARMICNISVNYADSDEKPDSIVFVNSEDRPATTEETTEETTEKPPSSEKDKPQTDDDTPVGLLISIFTVSGMVILLLIILYRRKPDDDSSSE